MTIPNKRQIAAVCGDGKIRLIEQDVPLLKPGTVLVEVHASLVSPGTELKSWRGFSEKRKNPDPNVTPRPFGYANAGVVIAVGEGVDRFAPGDRVACMGGSYAAHTDYAVVPHNLTSRLPDGVTFEQGSYACLSATALNGLRRDNPEFGSYVAVLGLGIVGQLAAQIYQIAGCYVIGWEMIPLRIDVARKWGITATAQIGKDDEVILTNAFTKNYGLDSAVMAFGNNADSALKSLTACMKTAPDGHKMGVIISLGGPPFQFSPSPTNLDIRRAGRTGPGYHDKAWEVGADYPRVFVRWSTKTNLELCLRLMAEGRLQVDALTTHRIALENVEEEIDALLDDPDSMLGVVFLPK